MEEPNTPNPPNLVPGAPSKETGYEVAEHLVLQGGEMSSQIWNSPEFYFARKLN